MAMVKRRRPTVTGAAGSRADYRADFADFDGWAYLNCAYHGPMPRRAEEALSAAVALRRNPAYLRDGYHFSFPDAYRRAVAALIGCAPARLAVADSTTHGITLLASGLDWRDGDEVVVPRGEFPSNRLPWLALAGRGVRLREVELGAPGEELERLAAAIGARTRVVSVSWVSFAAGRRLDLGAVGALARDRGTLFAVDGSQGVGGLPLDLAATPCDLLACSGYKWMLGPYGLGFVYLTPALAARLQPPSVNWFGVAGARDFHRLADLEVRYEGDSDDGDDSDGGGSMRRFDVNETANFFNIAAGTAAARLLADVTPAAVERHVQALHERLIAGLPAGFRPVEQGALRSNILCVAGEAKLVGRAFALLRARKVAVSHREGTIRVSPHLYNTEADIDRLLEALAEAAGVAPAASTVAPAAAATIASPRLGAAVAVDEPVALPPRQPLAGRHVILEPLDPVRHGGDLWRAGHGTPAREAVWTYMPYGPFPSAEAMAAWLETCAAASDPLFFAARATTSGRAVGMASYLRVAAEHRCCELGHIWYAPEAQGTELNTEAAYLMLRQAFELGYRRVEWKCDAENRRSRRAALRLGFCFEGVFAQHRIVKGRNRDTAWFAMLDRDWPAVCEAIERWLEADPAGRGSLRAGESLEARLERLLDLRDP